MTDKVSWAEQSWALADHIYRAILNLPFVCHLADGTLDQDIFERYIGQDSLYLGKYCKVLSHIATRLDDRDMTDAFLQFALDGVAVERALHSSFLTSRPENMSPACLMYTSLLTAQSQAPVEVEAAAVLPCFWVYQRVGKHIASHSMPSNPYSSWIATYSDPTFDKSTAIAIDICNRLAENASPDIRRQMSDIFVECTRMEWLFWHSAYINLNWPEEIR